MFRLLQVKISSRQNDTNDLITINIYSVESQESKLFEILKQVGIFQPDKLF